jgi:hypothetical protein
MRFSVGGAAFAWRTVVPPPLQHALPMCERPRSRCVMVRKALSKKLKKDIVFHNSRKDDFKRKIAVPPFLFMSENVVAPCEKRGVFAAQRIFLSLPQISVHREKLSRAGSRHATALTCCDHHI